MRSDPPHRLSRRRVAGAAVAALVGGGVAPPAATTAMIGSPRRARHGSRPGATIARQPTTAGPLRLSIAEMLRGDEAVAAVLAADGSNQPPRDGLTYLLLRLEIGNRGDRPVVVDPGDFAVVGAAGNPARFLGVAPPDPPLGGVLDAGAAADGWLAFAVPIDEPGQTLLFDSLTLPGTWADARLPLDPAADAGPTPEPEPKPDATAEPNRAGTDPAAPASLGEPVVTADWRLEPAEILTGADVFALVDYRAGALGEQEAVGQDQDNSVWLALRLRVDALATGTATATGTAPRFLPANAFALVDAAGDPLPDLITITPPRPDASGGYLPGTGRDGWVAFDLPAAAAAAAVRFLPYAATAADPDPRFLAIG